MAMTTLGHFLLVIGGGLIVMVLYAMALNYALCSVMPEAALRYPWLPIGWGRRVFGAAIIMFAIWQAVYGNNYQPFVFWLLLPFFSPRVVIAAGYCASRLSGLVQ
jgi:hypothetical protein